MLDNHTWGLCLAVVAGTMAALASVSAKLAVTADVVHELCLTFASSIDNMEISVICDSISYVLRGICVGGIFLFNALMWTFYTKSLQYCPSTVEATVTNTGANFLVSAVFGFSLFGESFSILWWFGSCLILAGLVLIHQGSQDTDNSHDDSKKVK
ncbi:transmembrane protein 42-like [Mercenaria mercenaria]|uniref:transmembrane protein 42-like n=1 Tax=Mercenaria mercenaria TaxID=6596 RepID=UPI00234F6DFE|nr:transmembrane protein 42-like [Mercenaria mercenaria]XP_053401209.1 transmembrane protein 42-like [Mercenaria mercenaria]